MGMACNMINPRDHDFKLARAACAGVAFPGAMESAATRWAIAGYDPICILHRGGQGVVYHAIQRSTGRSVAIKMIRSGAIASTNELARFQREVKILSQLRHPNIVTIYDSGQVDGAPYLVMDYIDGRPLNTYVADERPALEELVRLFALVADAVQAAHIRGVVHRDIKPANILIDDQGEPKIIDFGLAKTTPGVESVSEITLAGQILGTMPWAAPEQATGQHDQVDVRTDVYALGVVMYETLTGEFPYQITGHLHEIVHRIHTADPVHPRHYRPDIKDDLETIILRCLAKEPDRRYQSAGELARDLRHFLLGEAIEAKRDSHWYVLTKAARRQRGPLIAALLFLALLVTGLVVSITFWSRAERELLRANEIKKILFSIFAGVDPEVTQGQDTELLRLLMEDIEQKLTPGMDEIVEAEVRHALGTVFHSIDALQRSDDHYARSLEIRRRLLGVDHPDSLDTLHHIGKLRISQQRDAEAEEILKETLIRTQAQYGELHERTLNALNDHAMVIQHLGRLEESLDQLQRALTGYRQLLGDEHPDTLSLKQNLGMQYRLLGKFEEAEPLYQESLDGFRKALGESHPKTLSSMNNMGALLNAMGRPAEAESYYRKVLDLRKQVMGFEHMETLRVLNNLSSVLLDLGRTDEARELLEQGLPTARDKWAGTGLMGLYLIKIGRVQLHDGEYHDAEATLKEAHDLLISQYGEQHRHTVKVYQFLAELYAAWSGQSSDPEHERLAQHWKSRIPASGN